MPTTSVPAPSQAYLDAHKVLDRYKTEGVTRAESDEFIKGAIKELDNDTGKLSDNVGQVGVWAIEVDEAFDRVTRGLTNLVASYGSDFPPLNDFLSEWKGYNQASCLTAVCFSTYAHSSEHVSVLNRFDQVFLDMVGMIQTDQDRQDVIYELGSFASEDHDRSKEMSEGFMNLKTDIEDFVVRFDAYIEKTDAELQEQATQLQQQIEQLKSLILDLDKAIAEATGALLESAAAAETMVGVVGIVVAGTVLAVLLAERIANTIALADSQKELKDVNAKQEGLANIKSEFDGLRPDIALICAKLVLFAEIWNSVRDQTVHFQDQLKIGLEQVNNERFKLEIELARKLCKPLIDGLNKYAEQLVNRPTK
ncbi:hypothetical protein EST38_g7781 [Candolleomyces aberdarensis]|uniref:Uncharacterized protein n=1 Tax=Candolleomyces aberdarensis TaxID=2316362 RepID=A0A4Q2DHQ8_9AGAR|nr:hypothetical protein EST38_g7781 [Candolleomyces aberdarensis]